MSWHHMLCYGMVWHAWYGMELYGKVWFVIIWQVWHVVVWYGSNVWQGRVCHDMAWHGMVCHGTVWQEELAAAGDRQALAIASSASRQAF